MGLVNIFIKNKLHFLLGIPMTYIFVYTLKYEGPGVWYADICNSALIFVEYFKLFCTRKKKIVKIYKYSLCSVLFTPKLEKTNKIC